MKVESICWGKKAVGLGLMVAMTASMGCKSTEDRIAATVERTVEECRESEDRFFELTTADDATYEILAATCEEELSEVTMVDDFRGTVTTGPVTWTAEQDESRNGAIVMLRAAWPTLENALTLHNRPSQDTEHMEEAEEYFAQALEEFDDSAWLWQQRLDNLLKLRAETRRSDDEQSLVGDEVEAYLDEFNQWANDNDEHEARLAAQVAVVNHLMDYRQSRQNSIDRMGSDDRRWESRIEHAEEQGEHEEAQRVREEFEARINRRPEEEERLKGLMENAEREACQYTESMSTDGIDDESLKQAISQAKDSVDCNMDAGEEEGDAEGEDGEENGD